MEEIRFSETVIGRSALLAVTAGVRATNSALRLYVTIAEQYTLGLVPTITVGTSAKVFFDGVADFAKELNKSIGRESFVGSQAFTKNVTRVLRVHEFCVAFGWDTLKFISAFSSSPQKAVEALFGKPVADVAPVDATEAEAEAEAEGSVKKDIVEVAIGLFGQMNAEQLAECAVALMSMTSLKAAA